MARIAVKPVRAAPPFARLLIIFAIIFFTVPNLVSAAPGQVFDSPNLRFAPNWMTAETAAKLDLEFTVLVPEILPGPFEGEPSVTAWDGYYSLYWVIPGAPPTFLQISGEVGGEIPDYSKYDRNKQLQLNASVQGWDAYHDLTPIYDLVYWSANGVTYSVESQGLADSDTLSVANALIALAQPTPEDGSAEGPDNETGSAALIVPALVPSGAVIEIRVRNAAGITVSSDSGVFLETGDAAVFDNQADSLQWRAPEVDSETPLTFYLTDPNTGETLDWATTTVAPDSVSQVSDDNSSSAGDSTSQVNEPGVSDANDDLGGGAQATQESTQEPTPAVATSDPTMVTYDEVVGLPTGGPGDGLGGGTLAAPPTATRTPGPRPTPTLAPTLGQDGMVSSVIGPEGGTLKSPSGISIIVPAGALDQTATISIIPVADTKLPMQAAVEIVPGSGFDVTFAGEDGRAIENLAAQATLRVAFEDEPFEPLARIYRVDGGDLTGVASSRFDSGAVEAELDGFSRFVVAIPAPADKEQPRDVLPFLLGAGVILAAMIGITVLAGMFRPRRQRSVGSRRTPPRRAR